MNHKEQKLEILPLPAVKDYFQSNKIPPILPFIFIANSIKLKGHPAAIWCTYIGPLMPVRNAELYIKLSMLFQQSTGRGRDTFKGI